MSTVVGNSQSIRNLIEIAATYFDSYHSTPIGTLATPYTTTAMLAPLVARLENLRRAISSFMVLPTPTRFVLALFSPGMTVH